MEFNKILKDEQQITLRYQQRSTNRSNKSSSDHLSDEERDTLKVSKPRLSTSRSRRRQNLRNRKLKQLKYFIISLFDV